jgi:hypothetical protein
MFTSSECFDMLVLYGQCDESATVAAQEYAVRFPNREHPSKNIARSNETLGWEGVGNRQLLYFFKA